MKKAVERRQQARNEQGLKDKISESPNRNPIGNQGNKNFEEELKKAVERRQQTRNEQGLKDKIIENTKSSLNDLCLQAEEKSQKMSKNNEKSKQANERVYGIL